MFALSFYWVVPLSFVLLLSSSKRKRQTALRKSQRSSLSPFSEDQLSLNNPFHLLHPQSISNYYGYTLFNTLSFISTIFSFLLPICYVLQPHLLQHFSALLGFYLRFIIPFVYLSKFFIFTSYLFTIFCNSVTATTLQNNFPLQFSCYPNS